MALKYSNGANLAACFAERHITGCATEEIKLDGYRAEAVKSGGKITIYSRRKHLLNSKFGEVVAALGDLPDETVVDGELVALDQKGRPSFNLLQSVRSMNLLIVFYAFDVLVHKGKNLAAQPLSQRREVLEKIIRPRQRWPFRRSPTGSAHDILDSVKTHGMEGVVAKRADSA